MKVVVLLIVMCVVLFLIFTESGTWNGRGNQESFRGVHSCKFSTIDDQQHPESIYKGAYPRNAYGAINAESVLNCSVCQACMDPKKACQSSCRQCCFRCGICRCNPRLKRDSKKYINAPLYAEDKDDGEDKDDNDDEDQKDNSS